MFNRSFMGIMPYCIVFFVAVCVLVALIRRKLIISHKLFLPPSPPGWPIIGHLHILHKPIHQSLHKLAQTYGSIFFLRLGCMPTVVISSPEWAKEFLQAHDRDFSDRPRFEASKRLFYGNKSAVMMEHGPAWRELRKLYTLQILTIKRIEMFEQARHEEMALALHLIECQLSNNINGTAPIEIRSFVFNTVGNMMSSMLFSKRSFDHHKKSRFKEMVLEMAVLFGAPIIGDLIPWLSWLDIQGYKKQMDSLAIELDTFLEEVVMERLESRDEGMEEQKAGMDYLDLLTDIYKEDGQAGKESIKCILLDLLAAGTETSTTTVEWAMAELLRNPHCMEKLQEELDTINQAGSSWDTSNDKDYNTNDDGKIKLRIGVGDADLPKLSYMQAVIKETLRLHPPFPLLIRQMSKSLANGKEVGGYKLPKKTRLLLNLWAMGRDTKVWGEEADTFCPDRFLGTCPPDLRGQHFELLPFGSGRRGCPGMNLGLALVGSVLANLVHRFNWKLPHPPHTLDFSEAPSLTGPMAKPLLALPTCKPSSLTPRQG